MPLFLGTKVTIRIRTKRGRINQMSVANEDLIQIKVLRDLVVLITYRCSRHIITTITIWLRSGLPNNNLVEDLSHLITDTNNNMVDTCMEDQCQIKTEMIGGLVMAGAIPHIINTINRKVRIIKIDAGSVKVKMGTGRTRTCRTKAIIIIIRNRSINDRVKTSAGIMEEKSSNTTIIIRLLDISKTTREPIMGKHILVRSTLRKTKGTFQNTP